MKMLTKVKIIPDTKFIRVAIVALAALLGGPAANSTTLARMSIAQMTQAAHLVVRARCLSNSTAWDAGEIWTFTSFAIEETWKSAAGANPDRYVSVRLLGGTVGNLTSTVSGVPRFVPGEEIVLFLEATTRGDFSIVSWVQGTFRVRRDIRTNQEIAIQDTAAFETFEPATRQFRAVGLRNIPVEDLHSLVNAERSTLAARAQGAK
jgi:hypothetical protein